jgi:hypothetical protein
MAWWSIFAHDYHLARSSHHYRGQDGQRREEALVTPAEIEASFTDIIKSRVATESDMIKLGERLAFLKGEAHALRQQLKTKEADIIVNGGTATVAIDGKNETIRKAQAELAFAKDEGWQTADEALSGTLIDIESCERDIDLRKSALRAKELQLMFRIEQFQFLNTPRFYKET